MHNFLKCLTEEAKKHIDKYHQYHNQLHLNHQRKIKRGLSPSSKEVHTPEEWSVNKLHNPFHVLKNKKAITKSVIKKIEQYKYAPNSPHLKCIPKRGGGKRKVSVFQLPDAVVSKIVYDNLLKKNKHRFSSYSYAYRNDRNVHFAIQDIALGFRDNPRVFVAEFDFSKFFDSISHDYLNEQLERNGFLMSKTEKIIIDAFLALQPNDGIGVPQGTSISLFLANAVCWELDRNLENLGLRFARYADDTIIWSNDYNKICNSYEVINQFSLKSGVKINAKKSEGISLLPPQEYPTEIISHKSKVNFLGYSITSYNIQINENSIKKIKSNIQYILYRNIIQPLKRNPTLNRSNSNFLSAICQIRRYLYGDLTEYHLLQYKRGNLRKLRFKGLMSFYILADDENQLKELDKWMISAILKSLKLCFKEIKPIERDFPFNLDDKNIISICRDKKSEGGKRLYETPSFLRINQAIKLGLKNDGIEGTMNKNMRTYNY